MMVDADLLLFRGEGGEDDKIQQEKSALPKSINTE